MRIFSNQGIHITVQNPSLTRPVIMIRTTSPVTSWMEGTGAINFSAVFKRFKNDVINFALRGVNFYRSPVKYW